MNSLHKILKDPFSHFIIIGALLFAGYQLFNNQQKMADNEIKISEIDIENIIINWQKRWNSAPTKKELENLIEQQVREEILYREALTLNLQEGDTVIRRRLADKMAFIINDIVVPEQASDKQLLIFMQQYPEKFSAPQRYSFTHYYFNPDKHNQTQMQQVLTQAELQLAAGGKIASDDFAAGNQFQSLPEHQIARLFGRHFPQQLASIRLNTWSKPIQSGYGFHLVKITERSEASLAKLADIRDYVLTEWRAEQQVNANIEVYQTLRKDYDISIAIPNSDSFQQVSQ